MGCRRVILLAIAASLLSVAPLSAKEKKGQDVQKPATEVASKTEEKSLPKQSIKVNSEFGLGVGAQYNFFDVQPMSKNFSQSIDAKVSFGAALQFRLNIGKTFGIQPEIAYSYSVLKLKGSESKTTIKAKVNLVQFPLLVSFRIAMFRINFGPVFTLMDNPTYQLADTIDDTIKQMPLGKLHPSVTYAAGVSAKLSKRVFLDVRYAGQFTDVQTVNEFYWTLDKAKQPDAELFRTRNSSVQVRVGLLF